MPYISPMPVKPPFSASKFYPEYERMCEITCETPDYILYKGSWQPRDRHYYMVKKLYDELKKEEDKFNG